MNEDDCVIRGLQRGQAAGDGLLPAGSAANAAHRRCDAAQRVVELQLEAGGDGDHEGLDPAVDQRVDGAPDERDTLELYEGLRHGSSEPGTNTGRHHDGDDRYLSV